MKTTQAPEREMAAVSLRSAWDMRRACRPGSESPMSPSSSARGTSAATESIGVRTKVKVVKNKLAPPFREAEFDVLYGEGISESGTVLDAAVEQSLVEKSGTWYSFKNERIGQGRENAKKWLQENPASLADLEAKVREALGLRPPDSLK